MEILALAANCSYFRGVHEPVQTVRAEKEDIANKDLVVIGIDIRNQFGPEGAAEDMVRFSLGRFLCGDEAKAHLLAGKCMVTSDLGRLAVANQIAARIAHMSDGHTV